MHIYLRSFDAFMPQHLLDGPQIRSALQQVCGKGVPERMGADPLMDAANLTLALDDGEDHFPRQFRPSSVQKENIFVSLFNVQPISIIQV